MSENVSKCPEMALSVFFCLYLSQNACGRIFLYKQHIYILDLCSILSTKREA